MIFSEYEGEYNEINEKTFRDLGSGLRFDMGLFDFFYSKSLNLEIKKMMGQCNKFLHVAISVSEEAKKDLMPSLKNKRKILDQIMLIYKLEGKLDGGSFLALKKLKKECTKIYKDNFNYMGKSFEDEYMPVSYIVDPKGKFEDY